MGIWSFLIGGYAANAAANAVSPPTVNFRNSNYECRGMKPSGNKWVIKYGEKNSPSTSSITVSRKTRSTTAAGGIDIYWAD